VKFTAAVCVSADPPSDAVTVAVCAPPKVDRSVAMYRPFALSVTAESVPFVVDIVRVPPDAWSAVPAASRNCTVITTVLVPFAGMLCAPAVTELAVVEGMPATVVTAADCPVIAELSVAVKV
jgi:hypothetical protein